LIEPRTPQIIGLTGSIGMGKSTVAAMFLDAGVPVFDADAEVRAMQGPDGSLIGAIEKAFPGSTGPEGVNRDALGKQVFADQDALARLEAIMHPAVAAKRQDFLQDNAGAALVLFDIPLLFEKGGHRSVDHIVVVSTSAEIQRQRVLKRPDMTPEKFAYILSLQTPDAEKRDRADFIINTGTTLDETRMQVESLIEKLARAKG
jgi:dephospho-CoA kinase